ncbi:DUF4139 domain-containing protein [Eisenibacter elegans]|uniref:DUF4139 domain-containing protein n=1 Tax=Eisenibacter elegans TaxID=997 RepID=UPI00041B8F02|nr:DUF4139 domain-containing protein [Eisenibacter elegans]
MLSLKHLRLGAVLLGIFGSCVCSCLQAQTQVAAFKNGTAFVVKKQQVAAPQGSYVLETLPKATFGSLWLYAPDNSITAVRSSEAEVLSAPNKATNLTQLLQANLQKRVRITLQSGVVYDGVATQLQEQLVVFKTQTGQWLSFHPSQIQLLDLLEAPSLDFRTTQKQRILHLQFQQPRAQQALTMMYMEHGISWVPSYAIRLLPNNQAQLSLRATLINDAEDLEDAQVNFVVGVPNFAYTYLESPLVSNQSLQSFIQTLNGRSNLYTDRSMARADIMSQSMVNVVDESAYMSNVFDPSELDGIEAEDLFFYNANRLTLKKGERAFVEILNQRMGYEDIYETTIPTNPSYSIRDYDTKRDDIHQVWHAIRLSNQTKLPWTTGTVMITKEVEGIDKPISQDKLSYTAVGMESKIKLTMSPNIIVKSTEREVAKEEDKRTKDKIYYDLITVEAKIEIANFQQKSLTLDINRSLTGTPLRSDYDWETTAVPSRSSSLNDQHQIRWKVKLKAGEKKELTYRYQVYLRK